jgi:hypothetical protein
MASRRFRAIALIVGAVSAAGAVDGARAQQSIGSTTVVQNQVSRELAGASGPLAVGDAVYRSEVVKTGVDSSTKLVFLDSTNLAVGPTSRIVLDRFVYAGAPSAEKVAVNLAKGIFRFTTGELDKRAYTITTPTAAIGVRGTTLDIAVRSADTRVTLVEGLALVCPRKAISFDQQVRNCAAAFGGTGKGRCDCAALDHPGQTATARRVGGTTQASLSATPVNFASLCSGGSSLCSEESYAFGGGALCGR